LRKNPSDNLDFWVPEQLPYELIKRGYRKSKAGANMMSANIKITDVGKAFKRNAKEKIE
jgi:hypothetical protein